MPGTKQGALKRRQTMINKLGGTEAYLAHMKALSSLGGSTGTTGGFYANRELASRAGKIGGGRGRRKAKKT